MTRCGMCQTAEAQATKAEIERTWDDDKGAEVQTRVTFPICLGCAEHAYDGTEDIPGLLPLR